MLCLSAIWILNLKAQSVIGSWPWKHTPPAPPHPVGGTSLFLLLNSLWVWCSIAQVILWNGDNNVVRFNAPPGAREAKRSCEAVIKFTQYLLF